MWRRLTRIFIKEGTAPQVFGFFFKAVVQSVLIFGAEIWVVTPHIGWVLEGFQDQVAQRLTGRLPWRWYGGKWDYTLAAARERRRVTRQCRNTFIEGRTSLRGSQHRNQFWYYVKKHRENRGYGWG